MFKLNRMADMVHAKKFEKRSAVPMPDLSNEKIFPTKGKIKAICDPSLKWHLIDEHGMDSFTELPDGKLLFEHDYADEEGVLSWILSMRDAVTLLEPESIRQRLFYIATELSEKYRKE